MTAATDNAEVWDGADVYVGDVGSTGPVDTSTALDAAFKPVGLLNGDEGVTRARSIDTTDLSGWGYGVIRTVKSNYSETVSFVALEDNAEVFALLNPGSTTATATGTDTRTVKVPSTVQKALVIELRDGAKVKRRWYPKVELADFSDETDQEGDWSARTVTLKVIPASDKTLYKEILPTPSVPA